MNVKDLRGQRFGRLVALAPTAERWHSNVVWDCACDCGRRCQVPTSWLIRGIKRSCGCLQDEARRTDIAGQRRGHLTALYPTEERRKGSTVWVWRCECGREIRRALCLVMTDKNPSGTMCPDCARALKREQARRMAEALPRDEETGIGVAYLAGLRAGKPPRNNTSGVRGVSWHAGEQKWVARIQRDGKTRTLGYYDTIEEAAQARAEAVRRQYGAPEDKG